MWCDAIRIMRRLGDKELNLSEIELSGRLWAAFLIDAFIHLNDLVLGEVFHSGNYVSVRHLGSRLGLDSRSSA